MKTFRSIFSLALYLTVIFSTLAQDNGPLARGEKTISGNDQVSGTPDKQKVVVVTGARFSYKMVQRWIDDYNQVNPNVQIIIESRGSADPQYDILAEVYEQDEEIRKNREYLNVG